MFCAAPPPRKASFPKGWSVGRGRVREKGSQGLLTSLHHTRLWIELPRESVDRDTVFHVQATRRHHSARLRALYVGRDTGCTSKSLEMGQGCWSQRMGRAEYSFEHLRTSTLKSFLSLGILGASFSLSFGRNLKRKKQRGISEQRGILNGDVRGVFSSAADVLSWEGPRSEQTLFWCQSESVRLPASLWK